MEPRTGDVVVGVDGTAANEGAVRWAVAEAHRRGAPLTLVHVVPDRVPISPLLPLLSGDLTDVGTAVLSEVEKNVRRIAPDLEVEAWLHHGERALELVRAAERAWMLVLGRDDRSVLHRLMDGETATRAAARSGVPVVDVPPLWGLSPDDEARGVVVVGVKSPAYADALLEAGLDAARARGSRLVMLHAWHLPSAYDDIIEARVARERIERDGIVELESLLRPWSAVFPEVDVETRVVHDRPGHALVEAAGAADLLVVARRSHALTTTGRLGGTARAALRGAPCPVLVVPPSSNAELPSLQLEADGAPLK